MITCIGPIEKLVRHVLKQNFPTVLGSTIPKTGSHDDLRPGGNKKIHRKGGLSEIDSMRTCGTTVDRLEYQTEDTAARTTSTSSDLVGSEIRTQLPPQMHVSDRFEV